MTDITVYFHWPYCKRICPYCDFNVTRDRGQAVQTALFEAMLGDLSAQIKRVRPRRLKTLYFGGGTPSLMRPEWIKALIEAAHTGFGNHADEITIEANPTDAETAKYQDFKAAGVNRLSLGLQSLHDDDLKFLGRDHSADEALRALKVATSVFDRVSADLIYALPDQDLDQWSRDLETLAALGIDHISPYQLTIEPETAFGRAVRRKRFAPLRDDKAALFYERTQTVLDQLGFEAYEVSNHARSVSARSWHNYHIWQGVDYIGVGPGAHGRLTFEGERWATAGLADLKTYIDHFQQGLPPYEEQPLTPLEAEEEALQLGLRIRDGVDLARFSQIKLTEKAKPLAEMGYLVVQDNHLRATAKGRPLLDRLIYELLA